MVVLVCMSDIYIVGVTAYLIARTTSPNFRFLLTSFPIPPCQLPSVPPTNSYLYIPFLPCQVLLFVGPLTVDLCAVFGTCAELSGEGPQSHAWYGEVGPWLINSSTGSVFSVDILYRFISLSAIAINYRRRLTAPTCHPRILTTEMSSRTRRQRASAAQRSEESEVSPSGHGNGNGTIKKPSKPSSKESRENVFLFAPNLIGMVGSPRCPRITANKLPRLLPNRPSHRFSVLYASSPSNLLHLLQCLVSA